MPSIIQIQTTIDQEQAAQNLARDLVEQRLAACVQVSGPISSVYRWQGNVETSEEWICSIKTTSNRYAAVEKRIKMLHSYDEPEIFATEVTAISASYAEWLRAQTEPGHGET